MIKTSKQYALIATTLLYFTLSAIITWWFIQESQLYTSLQQKLLSCGIAGAKWGVQIIAALILLKDSKWLFIKNIGLVCLIGSAILLPYAAGSEFFNINGTGFFMGSLVLCVATMIFVYALAVKAAGAGIKWWVGWLCSLVVAVLLQLTVVFNVL